MTVSAAKQYPGSYSAKHRKRFLRSFFVRLTTIQAEIDRLLDIRSRSIAANNSRFKDGVKMVAGRVDTKPAEAIP